MSLLVGKSFPAHVGLSPLILNLDIADAPFPLTRGVEPKCTVPTEKKIGWGTLACHAVALAVFCVLVATGVLA